MSNIISFIAALVMMASSLGYMWIFRKQCKAYRKERDKASMTFQMDEEFYGNRLALLDGDVEKAKLHTARFRELHEAFIEHLKS